jgi:hypothetical protein
MRRLCRGGGPVLVGEAEAGTRASGRGDDPDDPGDPGAQNHNDDCSAGDHDCRRSASFDLGDSRADDRRRLDVVFVFWLFFIVRLLHHFDRHHHEHNHAAVVRAGLTLGASFSSTAMVSTNAEGSGHQENRRACDM